MSTAFPAATDLRSTNEMPTVDLYDSSYAAYGQRVYEQVRLETYGVDLGQTGWMTVEELRESIALLGLTNSSRVLEAGCGAGVCAIYLAEAIGAAVTGIDINESGIKNAQELARSSSAASRVDFACIDCSGPLPFDHCSFDAVFSNDAMCHMPNRLQVLAEWRRILKPGGRILFTDAMIVTGMISKEEIATRSSVGPYFFLPAGENERLIEAAGFELLSADDLTQAVTDVSGRWLEARSSKRKEMLRLEGEATYLGLQCFLACVHTVASERRLSRFRYVARSSVSNFAA